MLRRLARIAVTGWYREFSYPRDARRAALAPGLPLMAHPRATAARPDREGLCPVNTSTWGSWMVLENLQPGLGVARNFEGGAAMAAGQKRGVPGLVVRNPALTAGT